MCSLRRDWEIVSLDFLFTPADGLSYMYEPAVGEKYSVDPPTLVGNDSIGIRVIGPANAMIESSTHSCAGKASMLSSICPAAFVGGCVQDHSFVVVLEQ